MFGVIWGVLWRGHSGDHNYSLWYRVTRVGLMAFALLITLAVYKEQNGVDLESKPLVPYATALVSLFTLFHQYMGYKADLKRNRDKWVDDGIKNFCDESYPVPSSPPLPHVSSFTEEPKPDSLPRRQSF